MKNHLELTDVYQVAYLKLHDIQLRPILATERVIFLADDNERVRALLKAYNDGVNVSVSRYVAAIKQIKAIIFTLKTGQI